MAAKAGYALVSLEILALVAGGGWFLLQRSDNRPVLDPPHEAVAFAGAAPITSILVTQHSAGYDVFRFPSEDSLQDAMVGEAVDVWGDFSPVAGTTALKAPDDSRLKPVVKDIRVTPDRGQLRFLSFGPGAYLEGAGDPEQKQYPLDLTEEYPAMSIVQLVRCRVEPGKTLKTLELTNPKSGKTWLVVRAHSDGSFESLLSPGTSSQRVSGPVNSFVLVSVTWNPKQGNGVYRLAVRPVNGLPRQMRETKFEASGLEVVSQMRLGQKLEGGATPVGTMDLAETVVFNRELGTKDVIRVEDWLLKAYFSDLRRGPFSWEAASLTSSWGDDASWSGEGVPEANEEVQFTAAPRSEPVTVTLDGHRQIKRMIFSSASPSWTIADGFFKEPQLNITDGDTTGSEDISGTITVNDTILNLQSRIGGFDGAVSDEIIFWGDGGTVNFRKSVGSRINLGANPSASRGMVYEVHAPDIVTVRWYIGFHANPSKAPVNGTVSTFVRVNQNQKVSVDQIRIGGGGGGQFGVLTIQNKATWNQDKGAFYIGYSGSNGTQGRSNGRVELGHPNSAGNLTIGNDATLKVGDIGGTGVIDVNNGTLTIKAGNDTQSVTISNCGSDQVNGGGQGTVNLNSGGTISTARRFTRNVPTSNGSAKFNFNGGLLKIDRGTGDVTKDLFGPGITVTLNQGGAKIDTNGHSTVITRDLSGIGGLDKLGNGTLSLAGKNSYKGETTVRAGVLSVSGAALPPGGTLQITGGKVNLTGASRVSKLVVGGLPRAPGTWGATGSGAENIDDLSFNGPGSLTVGPN